MKVGGIAGAMFQCLAFPCVHGCPQGGQSGNLPPPGKWDYRNQKFLENLKSAAYSLNFCNGSFIFRYDTHTGQEPGSLLWCHALLSLQFTHVRYIACGGRLRNLSYKIGLHCVTVTRQQRLLQVAVVGV